MKILPLAASSLLIGMLASCGGSTAQNVVQQYISAANKQEPVGEYQCVLIDKPNQDIVGDSVSVGSPVPTGDPGQYTAPVTIIRDGVEFAMVATVFDTDIFIEQRKQETAKINQQMKESNDLIESISGEPSEVNYIELPSRDEFSKHRFCVTNIRP